ncbi:MAG: chemotaxis protein CheW [Gemmatimonadales bacterium]
MSQTPGLDVRVAALRQAFDESFAAPPPEESQGLEDLLRIRVAGDPYAIRLRDIAGVVARRKVVPIPGGSSDFLGSAGIRGGIVPVFALALLLGYDQAADLPSWMVLCGPDESVALAFPEFEGYSRLPHSWIHVDDNLRPASRHVKEVARMGLEFRPIISIPLIVATIRNRTGQTRSIDQ